jgi:kinesin family member 5
VNVQSMEEVLELLWTGAKARSICATDMNAHSSRSHTVFQVSITKVVHELKVSQVTKLSFVDLAGSEKVRKIYTYIYIVYMAVSVCVSLSLSYAHSH